MGKDTKVRQLVVCEVCGNEFLAPVRGRKVTKCEKCRRANNLWEVVGEREHPTFGVLIVERNRKTGRERLIVKG